MINGCENYMHKIEKYQTIHHAKFYFEEKHSFPDSTLELGTGWYPVVPISMFLLGADSINTIDITPLLDKENLIVTLKKFIEAINNNKIKIVQINNKRVDENTIINIYTFMNIKFFSKEHLINDLFSNKEVVVFAAICISLTNSSKR